MKAMNQNRPHILAEEILNIDEVALFVFHKTQTLSNILSKSLFPRHSIPPSYFSRLYKLSQS